MKNWRLSVPMSKYKAFRKMYEDAGVKIYVFKLPPNLEMSDAAQLLDQFYVPTRYPNGLESGAPMDFFTKEQATDAVRRADKNIRWCENIQGA